MLIIIFLQSMSLLNILMDSSYQFFFVSSITLMLINLTWTRNHFVCFLLLLEFMFIIIIIIISFLFLIQFLTTNFLILFFSVVVSGACLGLSIMVKITRSLTKEMNLNSIEF